MKLGFEFNRSSTFIIYAINKNISDGEFLQLVFNGKISIEQ